MAVWNKWAMFFRSLVEDIKASQRYVGEICALRDFVVHFCSSFQVLWGTARVYALQSNTTACPCVVTLNVALKCAWCWKYTFGCVNRNLICRIFNNSWSIEFYHEFMENFLILKFFFSCSLSSNTFLAHKVCLIVWTWKQWENTLFMLFLQPATRGWSRFFPFGKLTAIW